MSAKDIVINSTNTININIYDFNEVKKWCLDLECTPYDLFIAFKKVGTSFIKIKEYLKNNSKILH